MAVSDYDLQRARSYFDLDEGVIFLNHASHSPLPLPARRAYETFFDSWQRTAHSHDAESFRIFEELRSKLARIIQAAPEHIGLSPNTSFGFNILASGLRWRAGDNLVISEKEFPANVYPWLRLRPKGVEVRFAKIRDGFIDEDALISATDDKTRMMSVSWVQFNNGYRVDLGKLGQFCSERQIMLAVDSTQGTGVVPIDVPSLKVDLFTCGCQKWLLGPCGTGFYYLSEQAEELVDPPLSGWLSVDWHAEFGDLMRYDLEPRTGPARYEIGTYAFQDWRALDKSIDILLSFDRNDAWNHILSLTDRLMKFVATRPAVRLVSMDYPERRSGIVTFRTANSRALYDYLTALGFVVSFREGAIRVSPHFYNSMSEIDMLCDAISKFTG